MQLFENTNNIKLYVIIMQLCENTNRSPKSKKAYVPQMSVLSKALCPTAIIMSIIWT